MDSGYLVFISSQLPFRITRDSTVCCQQNAKKIGVAQWVARMTRDRWLLISREFESYQRVVSFSKKLYSHCLVLVESRNGFERDLHKQIIACFTIELK